MGTVGCAVSGPAYRPVSSVVCVRTWLVRPGETYSLLKLKLNCAGVESLCVCLFPSQCACESKMHVKIFVILERAKGHSRLDVGTAHETLMPFTI